MVNITYKLSHPLSIFSLIPFGDTYHQDVAPSGVEVLLGIFTIITVPQIPLVNQIETMHVQHDC